MKYELAKTCADLHTTMALIGPQLDQLDKERAQRVAAGGDWSDAERARYAALDAEYDVAFNAIEDIRELGCARSEPNGIAETSNVSSAQ